MKMHKIHHSIDIKAPKKRVWEVLWDEESFHKWSGAFTEELLYLKSNWEEGGRFEYFEGDVGSYGIIETLIPNETITFKHLGEIRKEKDYPYDDVARLETYTLEQTGGITKLTLDQDVPDEYKDMFVEATSKAFKKIKELAEKG
jgi:uncharacterized protein YndB with AHSA1/START domain